MKLATLNDRKSDASETETENMARRSAEDTQKQEAGTFADKNGVNGKGTHVETKSRI